MSGNSVPQGSKGRRSLGGTDQVVRASDVISERLVNVTDIQDMVESNRCASGPAL